MGLYINKFDNEGLYKSNEEVSNSNQNMSKIDPVEERIKEQKLAYTSLYDYLKVLESQTGKQNIVQSNRWNEIIVAVNKLKENDNKHDGYNEQFIVQLRKLEEKSELLFSSIENERLIKADFSEKIYHAKILNEDLMSKVESFEASNKEMLNVMKEQFEIQKETSEKIIKQEEKQNEIFVRIEHTEVLTEKMTRQLENLRSILFERSHYLAEKIEEGYQSTSSYFNRLIKRSTQSTSQEPEKESKAKEKT